MDYEKWIEKAKKTLENDILPGQKFEAKHLFPGHEWEALSAGEKLVLADTSLVQ